MAVNVAVWFTGHFSVVLEVAVNVAVWFTGHCGTRGGCECRRVVDVTLLYGTRDGSWC